jgi:hypothetical protein
MGGHRPPLQCGNRDFRIYVQSPLSLYPNLSRATTSDLWVMRTISNLPVFDKEVIRKRFAFVRSRPLSNVNSANAVARFIQYQRPWKLG